MRHFLAVALPPLILLCVLTSCCYVAAGEGLLLYLAGLAIAMLLTPPLALAQRGSIERLLVAASVVDGVGMVWLVATIRSETTFAQWIAAYILLAACVVAMTGLAAALARWVMREVFASAVSIVLALVWLSWPVWLSAWIDRPGVTRLIGWLVPVHPLLTINGLLVDLGVWGEQPLMYRLTSLGQDVPYQLPANVAAATLAHLLLGTVLFMLCRPRESNDTPAAQREAPVVG